MRRGESERGLGSGWEWETWVRSLGWEDPLEKGKANNIKYQSLFSGKNILVKPQIIWEIHKELKAMVPLRVGNRSVRKLFNYMPFCVCVLIISNISTLVLH